jgi:hypothetical protein
MLSRQTWVLALMCLLFCVIADEAYTQSKRGIRAVDFANFTYRLNGGTKIRLQNGRYKEQYDSNSSAIFSSKLAVLKYTDFNGDGKEEAVVVVQSSDTGGSNHGDNDYFVFEFVNGKPRQIFHEYYEGKKGICVKNRSLILIGESWDSDDHIPHCCPSFTETKVYRWRNSGLALVKRYVKKDYPYKTAKKFNLKICD